MTTNSTDFEEAIKSRFEQGFNEWNGGYEAWLEWCNTLYEPDAHYNIYSNRLTLQQYKDMMGQLFSAYDVELGEFHNMIIDGDWGAIRYSVHIINKHTGENIDARFAQIKLPLAQVFIAEGQEKQQPDRARQPGKEAEETGQPPVSVSYIIEAHQCKAQE